MQLTSKVMIDSFHSTSLLSTRFEIVKENVKECRRVCRINLPSSLLEAFVYGYDEYDV